MMRRLAQALLFFLIIALPAGLLGGCTSYAAESLPGRTPQVVTPAAHRSEAAAPATAAPARAPAPFTVAGWNIGLEDADPQVIAALLAGFRGVDIWGLVEANDQGQAVQRFEKAVESGERGDFAAVLGASGGGIRLLALYDQDRFALLGVEELDAINTTGNARAPLVLHLRDQASGQEFLFMVNHLYRSRAEERRTQAQLLAQWAKTQKLPIIAVGDYNFDWAVEDGQRKHDPAFDAMTAGDVWEWVQPATLVTTQCSGWPCRYNSVLDFVFTAGPARAWPARSTIAVIPGDFPDDTLRSDHRAVLAQFAAGGAVALASETASAPAAMPGAAAATPVPAAGAAGAPAYSCADNPSPPPNPACPIKGNISSAHIYHMPGQRDYCKTVIDESKGERWFCSPAEAEAAGWRAAQR